MSPESVRHWGLREVMYPTISTQDFESIEKVLEKDILWAWLLLWPDQRTQLRSEAMGFLQLPLAWLWVQHLDKPDKEGRHWACWELTSGRRRWAGRCRQVLTESKRESNQSSHLAPWGNENWEAPDGAQLMHISGQEKATLRGKKQVIGTFPSFFFFKENTVLRYN